MMDKRYGLLLFYCLLFTAVALAQSKDPARKLPDKIAPVDLAKDLEVLRSAMIQSHPRYTQYTSAATFDSAYQAKRTWILAQKDSISNGIAFLELSSFLALLRDGHSYFKKALKRTDFTTIPIVFLHLQDGYYLGNVPAKDSLFKVAKCLRLNGHPMDVLSQTFWRMRSGDGWSETFSKRITGFFLLDYYQAQFGATDTWDIEALCSDGVVRTLNLKGTPLWQPKSVQKLERMKQLKELAEKKSKEAAKPKDIIIFNRKNAASLYRPAADTSVVVLRITTFSFKRYSRFYRSSFQYLKTQQPRLFIVDVRNNLGGSVSNVATLLGYLQTRPYVWHNARKKKIIHPANTHTLLGRMRLKEILFTKKKSRGDLKYWNRVYKPHKPSKRYNPANLVVLQNAFSFSGGSVTASVLKNLCGAKVIGNETGGGEVSLNALKSQKIRLPHSKMNFLLAGYSVDMEVGKPDAGRGVLPDQWVLPTPEDVKAERDPALEAAILVGKKQ